MLSLILQGGVSRRRYRAMVPVGDQDGIMAYLRVLRPQAVIFTGRHETARPIHV
jgi:hypothetical protein